MKTYDKIGFSAVIISGILGAFGTCCLEQKSDVKDAGQSVALTCEVDTQKELCTEFTTVTCAKLASCSGNEYEQCKGIMEKDSKCLSTDARIISKCLQDFASIKCNEDLPESCNVLF